MPWGSILAVYFVSWWILLFAVLPFGVKNQAESGETYAPGADPGAPAAPRLMIKAVATSIVAAGVTALIVTFGPALLD